MNEKIPLKKFAEKVALTAHITTDEAEADIKSLFALVAEELRTGQPVKIKGLGEFKLSSDPHDPVVFIPDGEWAAEVNAPFAMFEPVAVNPAVSTEELEAINAPEEEEKSGGEDEVVAVAEETVVAAPEEPTHAEILRPEATAAPAPAPEPVKVAEVAKEAVEMPEAKPEPAPVPAVAPAPAPQAAPKPEVKLAPWPEEEYDDEEEREEREEGERAVAEPSKSGFGRGFLVGLIIGLAIGALALCAYVIYYVNADTPRPSLETELTVTDPLFAD